MTTTIQSNPSILAATIKHWQTADQGIPTTDLSKARYLTPAEITAPCLPAVPTPKSAMLRCWPAHSCPGFPFAIWHCTTARSSSSTVTASTAT